MAKGIILWPATFSMFSFSISAYHVVRYSSLAYFHLHLKGLVGFIYFTPFHSIVCIICGFHLTSIFFCWLSFLRDEFFFSPTLVSECNTLNPQHILVLVLNCVYWSWVCQKASSSLVVQWPGMVVGSRRSWTPDQFPYLGCKPEWYLFMLNMS